MEPTEQISSPDETVEAMSEISWLKKQMGRFTELRVALINVLHHSQKILKLNLS
jgi:hypothetical protein